MKQVIFYGGAAVAILTAIGLYYGFTNSNSCSGNLDFSAKSNKIDEIYKNTPPWPNKRIVENNKSINNKESLKTVKKDTIAPEPFVEIKKELDEISIEIKKDINKSNQVLNEFNTDKKELDKLVNEGEKILAKLDSQGLINKDELKNEIEEDMENFSIEQAPLSVKSNLKEAVDSTKELEKKLLKFKNQVEIK